MSEPISNTTCTRCQRCGKWTNYADDPCHKAREDKIARLEDQLERTQGYEARMANRLAQIERQVIYRTEDIPEWAVAWNKAASGRYCWFVGLHIAQEADNPTPQPAPDLRPDEPGPLWLPIIDAPDAGGEER